MDLPSSAHFIYIPGVLLLGLVLGFVWGSRTTREAYELAQRSADERARKKAERAAARAAQADPPPGGPDQG